MAVDIRCCSNIQDLINHIVFVIDASGSMDTMTENVINVFDAQINYLSIRSQELNQETRVSVYLFSDIVKCIIYDKDVMRLPSLRQHYNPVGSTSLLDGTYKALIDLDKTSQLYGDHAFLIYVITDGEENSSKIKSSDFKQKLGTISNNWTLAVLVPDQRGVFEAKKFGFSPNNIQIWDTSQDGLLRAGDNIRIATDNFLNNRAQGIRGTNNLFNIDMTNVTSEAVNQTLDHLDPATYDIYQCDAPASVKTFVENKGIVFSKGKVYYQLTKKEKIQSYKKIIIRDKTNNNMYGGNNSRVLLGLPNNDVDVKPSNFNNFDIFVESTSTNRKLIANTSVIITK